MMKNLEALAAIVIALLALLTAVGGGYVSVATKITVTEAEHIVDYKTSDKFAEVLRRFDKIDQDLSRLLDKIDKTQ